MSTVFTENNNPFEQNYEKHVSSQVTTAGNNVASTAKSTKLSKTPLHLEEVTDHLFRDAKRKTQP